MNNLLDAYCYANNQTKQKGVHIYPLRPENIARPADQIIARLHDLHRPSGFHLIVL